MRFVAAIALSGLMGLTGCDLLPQSAAPRASLPPAERPAAVVEPVPAPYTPSQASLDLALHYRQLQVDLLGQGLLRTDAGGAVSADTLSRNFEAIALTEEYTRGRGLEASSGALGPVKKWQSPVRVKAEFGATVPERKRSDDMASLTSYVQRLARVTGHPISMTDGTANFHVLFVSEDDGDLAARRMRQIVPNVDSATVSLVSNLPRGIHCLVAAFPQAGAPSTYGTAVAIIRVEHPTILRRACIHEEMAQGLGLANDSPSARPSIFNDDDEYAYLTSHDEMLLRILYDPRLAPGMSAATARPIVQTITAEMLGVAGPI